MYDQVDYQTYIEYFNLCAETALEYELESFNEIKIPVLFLAGEFDPLYPPRLQMMYYHYFKKSRIFIIPESSNAIMIDQPQKFTRQINLFLDSLNTEKIEDFNYFGVLDKELDDIVDTGLKIKNDEIHLKLIGEFQLIIDGKIVKGKWNQRKAMPIISYIIYHKTVTREELYEAFWPNSAIKNASNQLSVTLNHIKNLIESSTQKAFDYYFEVNRDWIGLKVEAEIDLLQFQQTLKEIENEFMIGKKTKWLISLLKQLNGGLNSLIYDDWFINLIRSIENQIQSICENLFNSQINEGDRIELLKEMLKHKVIEEENFKKLITLLKHYNDKDYLFYKKKYDQLVNF